MKGKGSVFVLEPSGRLVEMAEEMYDSETLFQELLGKYPNLLAGDQINPEAPCRFLLITREMPVPDSEGSGGRWSLDHLFVDQDGVPTLVEVKRSTDTRIRREVVGQMLDYAANGLVYWPIESLRERFGEQCKQTSSDPESVIQEFTGGTSTADDFWSRVQVNLQAGKVRLLFVADTIPPELQRIIEFVNGQMNPAEVLGIEIKLFQKDQLRTLVPRVIGRTGVADAIKGKRSRKSDWDESSFIENLMKNVPAVEVKTAQTIMEWGKKASDDTIYWGVGREYASFVPLVYVNGIKNQAFNLFSTGTLEVYFFWYANKPPFDSEEKRTEMLGMLNKLDGVSLPPDAIGRRPSVSLSILSRGENLKKFIGIMDWWLAAIRKAQG